MSQPDAAFVRQNPTLSRRHHVTEMRLAHFGLWTQEATGGRGTREAKRADGGGATHSAQKLIGSRALPARSESPSCSSAPARGMPSAMRF